MTAELSSRSLPNARNIDLWPRLRYHLGSFDGDKMKPVVSAFNAWTCTVISLFGVVILSIIGSLFARNHHMVMGLDEDAEDHKSVATAVFITVAIYAGFAAFCGSQAWLNQRQSRRGAISLR